MARVLGAPDGQFMRKLFKSALRRLGYDIVPCPRPGPHSSDPLAAILPDFSEIERRIIATARQFTMTSVERMATLLNATKYVASHKIPGDIVECGVWRGGSMMVVAHTLMAHGDRTRSLYLYDTYEGMSAPTAEDRALDGISAEAILQQEEPGTGIWCYASLEDVRANVLSTGYPADKVHFIKGKVEDTIPNTLPGKLALLRLDTDWYASTRHELEHLFPLLNSKGILIVDDYGHWQGARQAVDEYFGEQGSSFYLHRIDYTGRLLVKNGA
jgi:hypothetical protein